MPALGPIPGCRAVLLQDAGAGNSDIDYFVQVLDGQFSVNCKRFLVAGWNQWESNEAAAGALELFGASLPPNTTGPALIRQLLDRAVANQFNVVRAWAHSVTAQYALQVRPGDFLSGCLYGFALGAAVLGRIGPWQLVPLAVAPAMLFSLPQAAVQAREQCSAMQVSADHWSGLLHTCEPPLHYPQQHFTPADACSVGCCSQTVASQLLPYFRPTFWLPADRPWAIQ